MSVTKKVKKYFSDLSGANVSRRKDLYDQSKSNYSSILRDYDIKKKVLQESLREAQDARENARKSMDGLYQEYEEWLAGSTGGHRNAFRISPLNPDNADLLDASHTFGKYRDAVDKLRLKVRDQQINVRAKEDALKNEQKFFFQAADDAQKQRDLESGLLSEAMRDAKRARIGTAAVTIPAALVAAKSKLSKKDSEKVAMNTNVLQFFVKEAISLDDLARSGGRA